MTISNTTKQIWILYTRQILSGKMAAVPTKAFASKELCFEHYPGNWQYKGNNHYALNFNQRTGKSVRAQGFYIQHPIDFFDETDVTN